MSPGLRGALSVDMKQSEKENGNLETFVSKIIFSMYYKVRDFCALFGQPLEEISCFLFIFTLQFLQKAT